MRNFFYPIILILALAAAAAGLSILSPTSVEVKFRKEKPDIATTAQKKNANASSSTPTLEPLQSTTTDQENAPPQKAPEKETESNKSAQKNTTQPINRVGKQTDISENSQQITLQELEKQLQKAKERLSVYLKQVKERESSPPAPTSTPSYSFSSEINRETRKALVNILCDSQGNLSNSVSGSGVIVDPNGVILTNAHVAQLYLVRDYPSENYINCKIRTGSPARNIYKAELVYLSQKWLTENSKLITQTNPKGTGEHDYALLKITKKINGSELPEKFSYIPPTASTKNIKTGEKMLIAGYPAGFIGNVLIQKELYAASTIDEVEKLYTFEENKLDLLGFGGNIMAQKGASGAAVVDKHREVTGLVVTSTREEQISERDLRAITMGHINRSLKSETNLTLPGILDGNTEELHEKFRKKIAPAMRSILINSIKNVE